MSRHTHRPLILHGDMVSGKQGIQSRFGPSHSEKLSWGNQEPIWPLAAPALGAIPSARIQYLARHKRDFSAREDHRRKEEEKRQHPSPSLSTEYRHIVRLSTPGARSRRSSQEAGPPHTPHCETNCPIWHVGPKAKAAVITLRLLQLSGPKRNHPDFQSDREGAASVVSLSTKTARLSRRLAQLSLPRLRESNICCDRGRPEESVWTVSRAARKATVSARVERLATPKPLAEGYISPREPEWCPANVTTKSLLI